MIPAQMNAKARHSRPDPIEAVRPPKLFSLVFAGLLFGWAYTWAAPRFYRAEINAGFWLGALHGGLMPAALPSLLIGNDVPIYAVNNNGRVYKLGYIAGINLCGLVFFGLAFSKTKTSRCHSVKPATINLDHIHPARPPSNGSWGSKKSRAARS